MKTKLVSVMKLTKDRMDNLVPQAERVQLINTLKTTGATHLEIATVIGHPNFAEHSKLWAKDIHDAGLLVTWRSAHQNMEGLYGAEKYVGTLRKPPQFWIDEAVNAFNLIKDSIKAGDEEAIYPERTEGIFQDSTAFIGSGLPASYGTFFRDLHDTLDIFLWTVGLSANNASEYFSGWMPKLVSDTYGVTVVDHYVDGDPIKFEADVRTLKTKYGKPVYVQEGSPSRFVKATYDQAKTFFNVCKKLDDENLIYGFGSWSGWAGNPESIVDKINGVYSLNDSGKALKEWWNIIVPEPEPTPTPEINIDIALKSMEILRQVTVIVFGIGTLTLKVTKLKELLSKPIE